MTEVSGLRRVTGNLLSLSGAEIVSRLVGFFTTIWIARVMAPEGFGRISFAVGIVTYMGLLVSFGFDDYGIVGVAGNRDRGVLESTLESIMSARLVAVAGAALLLACSVWVVPALKPIGGIVLLYGLVLLAQGLSADWVYMATERMRPMAVASIIASLVYAPLVFLLVHSPNDIMALAALMMFRQAAPTLGLFAWGVRDKMFRLPAFTWSRVLPAFRGSASLGIAAIATQMYLSVDVLMIGFLATERAVGIYSAALRIVALGLGLRGLIGRVLYPSVARAVNTQSASGIDRIRHVLSASVPFGVALGGLGTVLAPAIILGVFGGQFSESVLIFQIVVWVFALEMMGLLLPYLMILFERRMYMYLMVSAAIVDVVLNFMLIPSMGPLGAGIAYTGCALGVFVVSWMLVRRHVGRPNVDLSSIASVVLALVGVGLFVGLDAISPLMAVFTGLTSCGAAVLVSSLHLVSLMRAQRSHADDIGAVGSGSPA